jgi:predicted MFS family arabinose efflux permease
MSGYRQPSAPRVPSVGRMASLSNPAALLGPGRIGLMTLTAAVATSTNYLLQPELTTVAADVHTSVSVMTVATGAAVLGYLLGLALLVPLVDRCRANRLVAGQLAALTGGLVVAGLAPNSAILALGMLFSGTCASTGAQMSTLAGKHARAKRRGAAVGTVTAGISAGILLGRIAGGALADAVGWRAMVLLAATVCAALAAAALVSLPATPVTARDSYADVLRRLPRLALSHRRLRISAVSGALWFFAFSLIWVGVSVALALPPLSLSSTDIGLYSLAGLAGILATRTAGVLADRHGSPGVIRAGLALAMSCTVTMAFALDSAPVLLATLALLDAGLFAAQVANQSRVLSIDPDRPAQFNSAYMAVYFIGGTIGTAAGGAITTELGWPAVAGIATAAIICAALINRTFGQTDAATRNGFASGDESPPEPGELLGEGTGRRLVIGR